MIASVLRKLFVSLLIVPFVIDISQFPWAVTGQAINRPPNFIPGSGDMARFSLSENTPVDSPVYQLKGKQLLVLANKPYKTNDFYICLRVVL